MNSMEQGMWDRLLEEKAELVAEVKQLREEVKRLRREEACGSFVCHGWWCVDRNG